MKLITKTLLFIFCLALSSSILAGSLVLREVDELKFGSFIPNSGGVLVLTPLGELRRDAGSVVAVEGAQVGRMQVEGSEGDIVWIHRAQNRIDLTHTANPAHSMQVREFRFGSTGVGTLYPSVPGIVLDGAGLGEFTVGATLFIGENQPPGEYEGQLEINVVRN